jgi:hypothetical protein
MLGEEDRYTGSTHSPERATIRIEEARLHAALATLMARNAARNTTGQLKREERYQLPQLPTSPYGIREQSFHYIELPLDCARQTDSAWLIELQGLSQQMPSMSLQIRGDVVLGITRPGTEPPDLDLSAHGAEEKGVSRRHALLRPGPNRLYLIDLQSTNGTRVNAMPVTSGVARELHSLDTVTLGTMSFVVKVLAAPDKFKQMRASVGAA